MCVHICFVNSGFANAFYFPSYVEVKQLNLHL